MVSGLDVSTERGGMNSDSVFVGDESGGADFDDRRAEFFDLFLGETLNGFELGEILRTGEDDAAKCSGGKDEEERAHAVLRWFIVSCTSHPIIE